MVIGIDFDNTVVCYQKAYEKIASNLGIQATKGRSTRQLIKDHCFSKEKGNLKWTLTQGRLYGVHIQEAELFEGVLETIEHILKQGCEVRIISHKSIYSSVGEIYDFWDGAENFIEREILSKLDNALRNRFSFIFCQTLDEKVMEIGKSNCGVFIDDLPEVLNHSSFPSSTQGVHFSESNGRNWVWIKETFNLSDRGKNQRSLLHLCRLSAELCFSSLLGELEEIPKRSERLAGGMNNFVFKIVCESGNHYCGKYYKRDENDPRDRMFHEVKFLEYCHFSEIDCVPTIFAKDWENGAVLMSYQEGSLWPENEPVPESVWSQFLAFFDKLQIKKESVFAKTLPRAAEGAISIQEHLGWVQKRRDLWRQRAVSGVVHPSFQEKILYELEDRYQQVAACCITHPDFKTEFPVQGHIISPSDFGLHNALVDENGQVRFIDFEYAGWDDSNKVFLDFAMQPKYRAQNRALMPVLWDPNSAEANLVSNVLELKWNYIILAKKCQRIKKQKNLSIAS